MQLFIGTYTEGTQSHGIYTLQFDERTAQITLLSCCSDCRNPSFLTQNSDWLYAAEELGDCGQIASFHIDAKGRLTRINQKSIPGSLTCHVQLSNKNNTLYAANYGSGCYFGCPTSSDGLCDPIMHLHDVGCGPNPERQEGPHAHSVNCSADGHELLVADLGTDHLYRYQIQVQGTLRPHPIQPKIAFPSGQGPRHVAFHPNGKFLYVVTELGNRVFQFTLHDGIWESSGSWSTLPNSFHGDNLAADIHLSPSGNYLYASNRGADDIAVFTVEANTGNLTLQAHIPAEGKGPRNFALLADGRYLLIANQNSDNLVLYSIEGSHATFISSTPIPSPVCICARQ